MRTDEEPILFTLEQAAGGMRFWPANRRTMKIMLACLLLPWLPAPLVALIFFQISIPAAIIAGGITLFSGFPVLMWLVFTRHERID